MQQQLLCIDEGMKKNEECGEEAEQKIEYHFEMCMNALAARKERLLRELGKNIADESMHLVFDLFLFSFLFPLLPLSPSHFTTHIDLCLQESL